MNAPNEVLEAAERRCKAVREYHLLPYAPLIRSGAYELVASMFPRFLAARGTELVINDIDRFFREFSAQRPEYIQLGTEFVRFMLPRMTDKVQRVLLEYEWILFDVEIDEAHVPPLQAEPEVSSLRINPTTRWLAAPFDLIDTAAGTTYIDSDSAGPFVYAIYRTADHRVMTQPLGQHDVAELANFEAGPVLIPPSDQTPWIAQALEGALMVRAT